MGDETQHLLDRLQQEEMAVERRDDERRRRRAGLAFRTWHLLGVVCVPLFVVIAILSAASASRTGKLEERFVAACLDGLGAVAYVLAALLPLCWIGAYLRGWIVRRAR